MIENDRLLLRRMAAMLYAMGRAAYTKEVNPGEAEDARDKLGEQLYWLSRAIEETVE